MHLLVTDRLACVRCGPAFGLILLADEIAERRVLEGALGCANCRERYPIQGGFGDLRPPPREEESASALPEPGSPEDTFRMAAMLGVSEGPGLLLLAGEPVAHAAGLAGMIDRIEVVALHPGLRDVPEEPGVSRITAGERWPFFTGSLRGVALEGSQVDRWLGEAVRVLGPAARVVVRDPREGLSQRLEDAGLQVLLETRRVVVGGREG